MAHRSIPSLPPLECLVAALTAARCGSFTAAAEELNVSHAAISRRVAGAEAWAAVALFERVGRGVRLTPDGQRVLGRIEHAFAIIDETADLWRKPKRRSLVIATTSSFAQVWLLPRLALLERAVAPLRIEVVTGQQNVNLATQEADIAIRYGRGGWQTHYEKPLFEQEALVPVVSRHHFSEVERKQATGNLAQLPLLHNGDTAGWRAWFNAHQLHFRNKAADRIYGDYVLTLTAAAEGLGVALLSKPTGAPQALQDQLVELAIPCAASALAYHVLADASASDAAVVACIAALHELASQ
ncbi:LysR substrate-binding domain-containing protein [Paraburkholderia fungorum]|uniref:LysR substrate-binding domain-containing protein n=1 Tax=Paraburkholderia fungorum TaxID=134537 RepID=UPI0038BA968B